MVVMTIQPSDELPRIHAGPLTRADLDALPDDGRRHELLDGVLIVSPAPRPKHRRAAFRLARLLDEMCPDGLEVFMAPLDVALGDDTVLEPDVLVTRVDDLTEKDLPKPPVLAVEVLSPSTRRYDLLLKRSRYEAAGTPSYWVVDPDEPSIIAWDLRDGQYVEAGRAKGSDALELAVPFGVRVVPELLVSSKRSSARDLDSNV